MFVIILMTSLRQDSSPPANLPAPPISTDLPYILLLLQEKSSLLDAHCLDQIWRKQVKNSENTSRNPEGKSIHNIPALSSRV